LVLVAAIVEVSEAIIIFLPLSILALAAAVKFAALAHLFKGIR